MCEYIWYLEEAMEDVFPQEDFDDDPYDLMDPDYWFMNKLNRRAMRLWKGEQVDGAVLQWGLNDYGELIEPREILSLPAAVMAGWRYLLSLKSTPRYMRLRAPMHVTLENKSWQEFCESGRVSSF